MENPCVCSYMANVFGCIVKRIGCSRKRKHKFLFFFQICAPAASRALLERTVVQVLQLLFHSPLDLSNREKLLIPKFGRNPCGCELYCSLSEAFVFRMANTSGNDCCAVILSYFLVATIQCSFITGVGRIL